MKLNVDQNDRGFRFVEIRHDAHDSRKLIVWIGRGILLTPTENEDKFVLEFPLRDTCIFRTEKGGLVFRSQKNSTVFYCEQSSGYRGSSDLVAESDCELVEKVWNLHSGRGSLGDTCCAFFQTDKKNCQVRWKKTGRRVDQTTGVWRLTVSGDREEIIDDPEICEFL
jgi:hypothetical protein